MIFDFIQDSFPVGLLIIHFFHRFADLGVSYGCEAEGIRKCRRRIAVRRRHPLFVAYLIEILALRGKTGDGRPVDIVAGYGLRRSNFGGEYGCVCKFCIIRRSPVDGSG